MYKLLIIEDEHIIRNYLLNALDYKELNITIVGNAENGKNGMLYIIEKQPDIVLTDINMPIMNAFEMFEQTKHLSYEKIILSGYNDFTNAKNALHYGVRDFLVKPINLIELRTCLIQVVVNLQHNSYQIEKHILEKCDLLKPVKYSRDEVVNKVISYISNHYQKKITVADISYFLGYSESYIHKKVKQHLGVTLNDYLNRYRMKIVINKLIENPNLLIYEVAEMVGYSDYKYFNQVFKKYLGMTVSDFKENIIN